MTKEERLNAEIERTRLMGEFEKEYIMYANVCGIDEAGRGPLCGPVVAGAVILPKECNILYINDSKKLTEKMRDKVYDEIAANAVAWAIGMASPERIDEINILQATYEAMREAIGKLKGTPDILLNDAVTIPGVDIKQIPIIKGDAKSRSIAAASIMAKCVVPTRRVLPETKITLGSAVISLLNNFCDCSSARNSSLASLKRSDAF